jgi:hypothetical protein
MERPQEAEKAAAATENQRSLPAKTPVEERVKTPEVRNPKLDPALRTKVAQSVKQVLAAEAESARRRVLAEFEPSKPVVKSQAESHPEPVVHHHKAPVRKFTPPKPVISKPRPIAQPVVHEKAVVKAEKPKVVEIAKKMPEASKRIDRARPIIEKRKIPPVAQPSIDYVRVVETSKFIEPAPADEVIIESQVVYESSSPTITEEEVEWFADQLVNRELTVDDIVMENSVDELELLPEVIVLGEFVNELRDLIELPIGETEEETELIGELVFNQQVIEAVVELDAPKAELAQMVLGEMMAASQELGELLSLGNETELIEAEAKLEKLCAEFLNVAGIEYNEVQLKQFVQYVLQIQKSYQKKVEAREMQISYDRGTREAKLNADMPDAVDWDTEFELLLSEQLGRASVKASSVRVALMA